MPASSLEADASNSHTSSVQLGVNRATGASLGLTPGAITTENIAVRATGFLLVAVLAVLAPLATDPPESPRTELTLWAPGVVAALRFLTVEGSCHPGAFEDCPDQMLTSHDLSWVTFTAGVACWPRPLLTPRTADAVTVGFTLLR